MAQLQSVGVYLSPGELFQANPSAATGADFWLGFIRAKSGDTFFFEYRKKVPIVDHSAAKNLIEKNTVGIALEFGGLLKVRATHTNGRYRIKVLEAFQSRTPDLFEKFPPLPSDLGVMLAAVNADPLLEIDESGTLNVLWALPGNDNAIIAYSAKDFWALAEQSANTP